MTKYRPDLKSDSCEACGIHPYEGQFGIEHTCDPCECGTPIGAHRGRGESQHSPGPDCDYVADLYCEKHDRSYERKYGQCIMCADWLFCKTCGKGPFFGEYGAKRCCEGVEVS
jgi:hypothetical protein